MDGLRERENESKEEAAESGIEAAVMPGEGAAESGEEAAESGEGAAESGRGAAVEVRGVAGVWHRGRLVERVAGTDPPRWRVLFDDGLVSDDIRIGDPLAPVRFDAGAYRSWVGVRFDGAWYRGRLVEMVSGSDVWGVAFEDGDWAEDVRVNSPDVRYVFEGGGAGRYHPPSRRTSSHPPSERTSTQDPYAPAKRGRGEDEQLLRKLVQEQVEKQMLSHEWEPYVDPRMTDRASPSNSEPPADHATHAPHPDTRGSPPAVSGELPSLGSSQGAL